MPVNEGAKDNEYLLPANCCLQIMHQAESDSQLHPPALLWAKQRERNSSFAIGWKHQLQKSWKRSQSSRKKFNSSVITLLSQTVEFTICWFSDQALCGAGFGVLLLVRFYSQIFLFSTSSVLWDFFFSHVPSYLECTSRKEFSLLLADLETSEMFSARGYIKVNIQVKFK